MATIRICDWTKKVLTNEEDIFVIEVEGNEVHKFEVGLEGRKLLLKQLEGEDELNTPVLKVVEKVVYRDTPPGTLQAGPPGLDIDVPGAGFEPGPNSMPRAPQAQEANLEAGDAAFDLGEEGEGELTPLEIPEDGKKKFKPPTMKQADKVVIDSTHFREGSLAALNPGATAQREASAKLRAMRDRDTDHLNSKANHGIRLKDLND